MSALRAPLFTPTTARDLHRNLAEWFQSHEAQLWAEARHAEAARDQQPAEVDKDVDDPDKVRHRLLAAETFLVTDEMAAVCRQAGQTLPDIIAEHAMLPAEVGFMVFNDRPDEHDKRVVALPVQAVLWWPGSYYGTSGVCIETFLWPDTARSVFSYMAGIQERIATRRAQIERLEAEGSISPEHARQDIDALLEEARAEADFTEVNAARREAAEWDALLSRWRFPAMPTLMTYLPYGQPPPPDAIADQETDYTVRMVLAAWHLMDQPLAARDKPRVERAAAKRAARAGLFSDLTVIRLRQPKSAGTGEAGREYHQRWIVRGHWRRIPTPEQPSRVTWVHGYVKGPADAPLVVKDRVTVLAR